MLCSASIAANQGRWKPAPDPDPGYTGQMALTELAVAGVTLTHYKARAYSPTLGRFLAGDPIGYGDGMNMYAYVGNDPVNATDPSGLQATETTAKPQVDQDGSDTIKVTATRIVESLLATFDRISTLSIAEINPTNTTEAVLEGGPQRDPVCSAPLTAPGNRGQTISSRRAQVRAEVARAVNLASRTGGDVGAAFNAEVGRNAARLAPGGSWIRGQATPADGNRLYGAITAELGVPLGGAIAFGDIDEIVDDALGYIGIRSYDGNFGPDSPEAKRQIRQGAGC